MFIKNEKSTMEDSILTTVVLPLSLVIIMIGMGMSLTVEDFKRVVVYPKATLIGLFNQLIMLPIIGFGLVTLFGIEPVLAVGVMIIVACPGGVTSNLITHVAKGDIALSVTLTAIASFITIITIPLILSYSIQHFLNDGTRSVELPIGNTILQVMVITVIPISIGMLIRHFKTDFANRMEKPMRTASTVIFLVVLIGIILANREVLIPSMKKVGLLMLALNVLTIGLGYFSAKLFQLNTKQSISIMIENGVQNGTLAIVIATTILLEPEMSIPAAVYSLFMFMTGGIIMWTFGRKPEQK